MGRFRGPGLLRSGSLVYTYMPRYFVIGLAHDGRHRPTKQLDGIVHRVDDNILESLIHPEVDLGYLTCSYILGESILLRLNIGFAQTPALESC
jgi:hypothetical protein